MRESLSIQADVLILTPENVFSLQGMPRGIVPGKRLMRLYDEAAALFRAEADPRAVLSPISIDDFMKLYDSTSTERSDTPLPAIAAAADRLVLFILTIGEGVSRKVEALFREGRDDVAFTMDAVASAGAEAAAETLQERTGKNIYGRAMTSMKKILRYSPGYCGWDISGQRTIVEILQPADIGVSITGSCMMRPIKSLSGVMVAGDRSIHSFTNDYPFCSRCATKQCRERIHAE